jgi:hypothetical protein
MASKAKIAMKAVLDFMSGSGRSAAAKTHPLRKTADAAIQADRLAGRDLRLDCAARWAAQEQS